MIFWVRHIVLTHAPACETYPGCCGERTFISSHCCIVLLSTNIPQYIWPFYYWLMFVLFQGFFICLVFFFWLLHIMVLWTLLQVFWVHIYRHFCFLHIEEQHWLYQRVHKCLVLADNTKQFLTLYQFCTWAFCLLYSLTNTYDLKLLHKSLAILVGISLWLYFAFSWWVRCWVLTLTIFIFSFFVKCLLKYFSVCSFSYCTSYPLLTDLWEF